MSDRFVYPGACFIGNQFVHCSLEEIGCDGMTYRSNRELMDLNTNHVARTSCMQKTHPGRIGICATSLDQYHCTGHPKGCSIYARFIHNSKFCDLHYNRFPDRSSHLSTWGQCVSKVQNKRTCVWSIDDCPGIGETNDYNPVSISGGDCTCDKVKVGACFGSETNEKTCAVSADACDAFSNYRTWQQLEAQGESPCFLCDTFDKSVEAAPVLTSAGFDDSNSNNESSACSSSSGLGPGDIAAISLSGLLVIVLGIEIYYRLLRRRNKKKSSQKKETTETNKNDFSEVDVPEISLPEISIS